MARFGDSVRRFTIRAKRLRSDVLDRAAIEVFERIRQRTPIDTGYARSRWTLTATSALSRRIGNDAPYIVALEFGHSAQAPAGMVRVTVEEWPEIVRRAAAEIADGR